MSAEKSRMERKRKACIKAIHAAARALCLCEDDRRALYVRETQKNTLTAMSLREVERVKGALNRSKAKPPPRSSRADIRLIFGLWSGLYEKSLVKDSRRTATVAWVRRNFSVDDPEWLSASQAQNAIEMLKKWSARGESNVK